MIVDEDELEALRDRLHAARRSLSKAYDRRDALAEQIAVLETDSGVPIRPELVAALGAAERAVLAAEADAKDAEYALAVATEPTVLPLASREAR